MSLDTNPWLLAAFAAALRFAFDRIARWLDARRRRSISDDRQE